MQVYTSYSRAVEQLAKGDRFPRSIGKEGDQDIPMAMAMAEPQPVVQKRLWWWIKYHRTRHIEYNYGKVQVGDGSEASAREYSHIKMDAGEMQVQSRWKCKWSSWCSHQASRQNIKSLVCSRPRPPPLTIGYNRKLRPCPRALYREWVWCQ